MNTSLKYKTFEQLVNSVTTDLQLLYLENFIRPADLIKVATKINREFGLIINTSKPQLLNVCDYKARLPDDYVAINFALACRDITDFEEVENVVEKTYTEFVTLSQTPYVITHNLGTKNVTIDFYDHLGNYISGVAKILTSETVEVTCECPTELENIKVVVTVVKESCELTLCNNVPTIFFQRGLYSRSYSNVVPIDIIKHTDFPKMCGTSPLLRASIKDNFIHTSFKEGTVFINYVSSLENEDGDLLVLDHDLVNDYYEYALKTRIFENMFLSGEDVERKVMFLKAQEKVARNNALSFVNTPSFYSLKKMWQNHRRLMYNKYYNIFK
jgi:hypothetical protein